MVHRNRFRRPFQVILGLVIAVSCTASGDRTDITGEPPEPPPSPPDTATVQIDTATRYQTMEGWEVHAEVGLDLPPFALFRDELFDRVVNEAGINRISLPVRSGVESDQDYWSQRQAGTITNDQWRAVRYATVNDNASPNIINPAGFHFSEIDDLVSRIVLPIRDRLTANGEALYVTLEYIAFTAQITTGSYDHDDPAEYAEFILATFQHLQSEFGLVPDGLEIILEPDNVSQWTPAYTGQAIVAVADRLAAAGFTPDIIAPSTTNMSTALVFYDSWPAAVRNRVHTVSYHRYSGVSTEALQAIAGLGKATAMLEWWNMANDYRTLHEDLKVGQVSAWQQGAIGGSLPGLMAVYNVDNQANVLMSPKTAYFRQYYRYVRRGAVRIGASSTNSALDPLAFVNVDGRQVVVVKADETASFTVGGLEPGTYGIMYAVEGAWGVEQPDQTISAGQAVSPSIPGAGVITIYRK